MRITVVGAGVIGLLAAMESARAGRHVVVIDQGTIPNPDSTSFDPHRILRAVHAGDPVATADGVHAHHRWTELERTLSAPLYHRVGALTVLEPDDVPAAVSAVAQAGGRARVLGATEITSEYPQLRLAADAVAVLEADAGVLLADRVLTALAGWLRAHPRVELMPGRTATAVDPGTAAVHLSDGTVVHADAAVLALGPWSRRLLPAAVAQALRLHRQSVLYCRVPRRHAAAWRGTPAIPSLGTDGGAWLVPPVAGTPLKLSADSACRIVDEVAGQATPEHWRRHLLDTVGPTCRGFTPGWVRGARDCYYLSSEETGGTRYAELGDAVLAYAACGGSSFKFAPLIARSLTRRLTGSATAH